MNELSALLSPIRVKNLEIPNRAVMPPMGTALCEKGGAVSEALLAYMARQSESRAGLLISEITAVHPTGLVSPLELGAWDDRFIPGLAKLSSVMRSKGSKAVMQLHHAGRESGYLLKKKTAIGPSALPSLVYGHPPREMTQQDIEEIISAFGQAGRRAREAGFDAVEIHGAHGYLITQFLSAISNQRSDAYGGDLAGRARFAVDVVRSVRKSVGEDFPILFRISAEEFIKNGYTVDQILTVIPVLVAAGADVIHASVGTHGSPGGVTSAPPAFETGFNVWRAERIKKETGVPVIAVGRFTDPRPANDIIARGQADLVAFGRQQLCDPDFLVKAENGRFSDIRKCIACNQGCIEREMFEGKSIRCAINPETGQEMIYPRTPSENPKRVWVVGSGPAGLTAASEAKRLGHDVKLFEMEKETGGNVIYASKAPHKEVYGEWIRWQAGQVERAGIPLLIGTPVNARMLEDERPDEVILAVGGEKIVPDIPGIDRPHVFDPWQILGESVPAGKNALVVGGGLIGMETACFLASRRTGVTLIEQLASSPVPRYTSHGYSLHKYLREKGCRLLFGATLKEIGDKTVTLSVNGEKEEIPGFDQVVLAVGMKSRDSLKHELDQAGIPFKVVGDARDVRRIMEATEEGAKAAWEL